MPLITTSHDSLPYIDPSLPPSSLTAAQALIDASLPPDPQPLHPLLPPLPRSSSSASSSLLPHLSASTSPPPKINAIDTSRYELDPTTTTTTNTPAVPGADNLHSISTLQIAHLYLSLRTQALSVLDAHGRNAWLVGNNILEAQLGTLERELERCRAEVNRVNWERQMAQEARRAEMEGGEREWKKGVGGLVDVLVVGREGGGGRIGER